MHFDQLPPVRTAPLGYYFVASALLGLGVQQLVLGRLVTRVVLAEGFWGPLPPAVAYVSGVLFVAIGAGLIFQKAPARLGKIFATLCLASFLALHLRFVIGDVRWGGAWTNAGKVLTFCAVGLALVGRGESEADQTAALSGRRRSRQLSFIARMLFAGFLILAGIQHFVWAQFVQALVPAWIPGAQFWSYFSGVALMLGGAGLLLRATYRWTALVTGAMIFTWFLVLHLPRALTIRNANETTAACEALAFVGLSWMLAGETDERERADGSSRQT